MARPCSRIPVTEQPPHPSGLPVVGQTVSFLRDPLSCYESWAGIDDVVRVRVGATRYYLVTHPAAIERVLVTDAGTYEKGRVVQNRLESLLGESVFLREGDAWRDRRRTLQPAFERDRLRADGTVMTRWAAETVTAWPTGQLRIDDRLADLALSILAKTLFDIDVRGEQTAIHRVADTVMRRFDMRSLSTFLPEWVPTPTNRRYRQAVADLDRDITARLDDRDGSGEDLLSQLIEAGLPADQIRDELVTFLFAGYESTATTLAFVLHQLGANPDVQQRVVAQLDTEIGDRRPRVSDLERLSRLDVVVRETLRLYPSQYVLFREPQTAVELRGYHVPAGAPLVLPSWVVHRDPRFWTDPDRFRPNRWDDDAPDRPEYAYFPFGGGPRHCLGMGMANQLIRLVVATALQHRQFRSQTPLSVRAGPTLQPSDGVTVTATER